MTNLGMIQALLKNNVINEGSFVFFDEPETNLHPAWQVFKVSSKS
jgi:predicted ATP-dependent endonuclease of OLD family